MGPKRLDSQNQLDGCQKVELMDVVTIVNIFDFFFFNFKLSQCKNLKQKIKDRKKKNKEKKISEQEIKFSKKKKSPNMATL